MYNALDVAGYIIQYAVSRAIKVSNFKLQALLYFVQGYFYSTLGVPCFEDDFEARDCGPVIPKVYRHYSTFGTASLHWHEDMQNYKPLIAESDRVRIEDVVDLYAKDKAVDLLEMAAHQTPWKTADNIIPKEAIKEFFTES